MGQFRSGHAKLNVITMAAVFNYHMVGIFGGGKFGKLLVIHQVTIQIEVTINKLLTDLFIC